MGGWYTPVPSGEPSMFGGFDFGSIFRTVTDITSPFLKTVSSAFGTKVAQDIIGIKPPQLSYGANAPMSNNALPGSTLVPRYQTAGGGGYSVGGGNPYPIIEGGGGGGMFANPIMLALAGGVLFVVLLLVRK